MKVFVYGTLKNGLNGRDGELLGQATTVDEYILWDYGFPALQSPGDDETRPPNIGNLKPLQGRVIGELYEIDPDSGVLDSLDAYEGYPHFYTRRRIPITKADEEEVVEAWTYFGREVLENSPRTHPPFFIPDSTGVIEYPFNKRR